MGSAGYRIQRRRLKGWRAPANAVYIGRPSAFENLHTILTHGRAEAIRLFRLDIASRPPAIRERMLDMLEGKVLMCWCALDEPCHGDVWLELLAQRAAPSPNVHVEGEET